MPMSLVVTGLVLMVCQIAVTVYLVRVIARMAQIDARVARLADAMALLTETTESSFGVVATQLERMSVTTSNRRGTPARTTTARVAGAARRGRSVGEIAAKEGVSEGEVRLRLHLAEHARPASGH
jgi:hypothetical protein